MDYEVTVPVGFPCPPQAVFEVMSNLGRYPDWAQGVVSCSTTGPMRAGLKFTTESMFMGQVNRAEITVRKLIPNHQIVLESSNGLVTFVATYTITEAAGGQCRVVCHVRFNYFNEEHNLDRPVRQASAEARIRGDLDALRSLLSDAIVQRRTA